jgi:hypothetical protein
MSKTNDKTEIAREQRQSKRLAQTHYDSASELRLILDTPSWLTFKPSRSTRQRASMWLNRLLKEAGIERGKEGAEKAYLAAIRALRDTKGSDYSYNAKQIARVSKDFLSERMSSTPPRAARPSATSKHENCRDDLDAFGVLKGDTLEAVETGISDLLLGDLIIIFDAKRTKIEGIGRFAGTEDDHAEEDSEKINAFCVDESDDNYRYEGDHFQVSRVVAVTRRIEIGRGTPETFDAAARKARLAQLRRRLERLDRDEITDSTARFKLERQIYDLEHEPADEWEGFDTVGE